MGCLKCKFKSICDSPLSFFSIVIQDVIPDRVGIPYTPKRDAIPSLRLE